MPTVIAPPTNAMVPIALRAAQLALVQVVNDAAQLQIGSTVGVQGYLAQQIALAQERATSLASSNPTDAAIYTDQAAMLQTIQSLCNGVSSDLQTQAIALKPAVNGAPIAAATTGVSTGTAVAASAGSAVVGFAISKLLDSVL